MVPHLKMGILEVFKGPYKKHLELKKTMASQSDPKRDMGGLEQALSIGNLKFVDLLRLQKVKSSQDSN